MKKSIRKIVSVLMAVCLCTSMVPAQAVAAPIATNTTDQEFIDQAGSSPSTDEGNRYGNDINGNVNGDFAANAEQLANGEATGSTSVFGVIQDENFSFIKQSPDVNFTTVDDAVNNTQPGATPGPLYAIFGGANGNYEYTWALDEVTADADGSYVYTPHTFTGTPPTFTGPSETDLTGGSGTLGTIDADGNPTGTWVPAKFGDPDNGFRFDYSISQDDSLELNKVYRYTLFIKNPTNKNVIKAEILVGTLENYDNLKIFLDQNEQSGTSVEGFLYTSVTPPVMPILKGQELPETSPVHSLMTDAAASKSPTQAITAPTQLVLTGLEDLPDGTPPYQLTLNTHLEVPKDYPGTLEVGDTVPVYRYDQETGQVEEVTGTVVQQTDRNGNPVTVPGPDGTDVPVLSIEFPLRGTGAALGTFAVGYENTDENGDDKGAFTVDASATAGGSISPAGQCTYPVGTSPQFVMNAQAGYELDTVRLWRGSSSVTMAPASINGNVFTLDAGIYNMAKGDAWEVEAQFEEAAPALDEYPVTARLEGQGSGTMTVLSGAAGAQPNTVNMGDTMAAVSMPAKDGVYLEFSPGSGYRVEWLTVNGMPFVVAGTSYFISTLTGNTEIVAHYSEGLPDPTVKRTITATVMNPEGGNVMDSEGKPQTTATIETHYGGTGTVTVVPEDGWAVESAILKKAGATDGINMADHLTQDGSVSNLQIRNVLDDMVLEVTFVKASGTITISVEGNVGGTVSPVGPVQMMADKAVTVRITPDKDSQGDPYTIGQIKLNGMPIPIADYLTERNGGEYYTFNIVMSDQSASNFEKNPDGTVDKVLSFTNPNSTLVISFDGATPPAESYVTVLTSVDGGGGNVTPTQRVPSGSAVVVYAFPDEGKKVKDVTLDGKSVKNLLLDLDDHESEDGVKLVLSNVTVDHEVVVSFEDGESPYWPSKFVRHTVRATAGTGGSVTPTPDVLVYDGQDQLFSPLASTGYELSAIKRDGLPVYPDGLDPDKESMEGVTAYKLLKVTADHNLMFTFKKTSGAATDRGTFNVQVNAGENGTASPLGTIAVARGTDLPITVLPNKNYSVDKILVRFADGSADSAIDFATSLVNGVYTQMDVQADLVIDITFKEGEDPNQPSTDLNNLIRLGTQNADIHPGVTLSPQVPGLTFYKEEGTDHANINQNFTIQVAAGYALGEVTVNGKTLPVTEVAEGVYAFVVPKEDITSQMLLKITATQVPPPTQVVDLRTITVTKEGSGTVSPYGIINGVVRVETGESQTFSFVPDDGWKVERVEVDGVSVSWDLATSSYTIPAVTQDMRIHVVFSENPGTTRPNTATITVNMDLGDDGKAHGFTSVNRAEVVIPGQLSITFKPDSGYATKVYRVNGGTRTDITDQLRNGTLQLTDIRENREYAVAFTPLTQTASYQTVTAYAGSNGRISPEGTMSVVTGTDMTFTFLANDGYIVDKVWVTRGTNESEEVSADLDPVTMSYTVRNITESVDVWANFRQVGPDDPNVPSNSCVLEAIAGAGGLVTPMRIEAMPGAMATFTFIPVRGYELLEVTSNGVDVTDQVKDGIYTFKVTGNASIHALFTSNASSNPEGNKHDVILQVANGDDGQPHGQVSPAGLVSVPHGGSVPFTMIPDEGYKVGSIEREINGVTSQVKDFSGFKYTLFDVEADTTITVKFVPLADGEVIQRPVIHEVLATASINGTISPSGTVKVAEGGMAMFSFQPHDGYRLSYLVVDGKDTPASEVVRGQYSFLGVQEDHTIHAVFCKADEEAADFVTINAGRPSGGTISPAGAQLVFRGSNAQFTVSPYYGYTLADIQLNGKSIFADGPDGTKNVIPVNNAQVSWANSTLTLKNVQVDTGIVALFRQSSNAPGTEPMEYAHITMDATGAGSTSFRNGTTVIEALKDTEKLDVSLIPNEGYAIGSLHVKAANGDDLDLTDATDPAVAQKLKDIWRLGYLSLSAGQVNYEVTITVTFRKQTDEEKKEIEEGKFKPASYRTISAMAFGRGSINPHGMIKVATGASIRFSMIPEAGYELSSLRIDGNDAMNQMQGRSFTFTPGTRDQSIEATFGQLVAPDAGVTYFVRTATDGTDGASGHASVPEVEVFAGGSASLYFWPEKGSKLTGLTVSMKNGNDVNEVTFAHNLPEYTVTGITGDTLVTAHFEPLGPDETTWTTTDAYVEGHVLNRELWDGAQAGLGVVTDGIVFDESGGRISPQKATVPKGCQQVFNFFPNDGFEVAFLLVDQRVVYVDANIRSYPMIVDSTDPAKPNTLVVAYRDTRAEVSDVTVTAKVDYSASEGTAEIWPGSRTVPYGSSASFFVKPELGYTITDVTWDDGVNDPQPVPFEGIVTDQKEHYANGQAPWDKQSRAAGDPAAQAAGDLEERDEFFEVYQFNIPNVTRDVTANVTLQPIAKVNPTKDYYFYWCNEHTLEITSEGGGTVNPVGKGFLPEGYSETIRLAAFTGYYLESVICTYGDGTTVDMTNRVVGNSLQVVMGTQDMHIHAKFTPVGETSYVHFELGSATDPLGNDLVYTGQINTTPPLSVNGVPTDFVRDTDGTGDGVLIGFLPDEGVVGPNGRPLVLDKVFVNGQQIPLTYPDSQYTRVPTTAGGTIDVVFRELEEGHELIIPDMVYLSAEVTSGQGTVSPSIKLPVGKGSSQKVGFQPAEGWMLDTENCYDWYKEDGAEEATAHKISAADLANGYYLLEGMDRDHRITVAFVRFVNLELGWTNGDDGYVTPNTMNGEALKIEVGQSVPFIVAPYEGFDVKSVMETMGADETDVTGTLRMSEATTQQLLAMPGNEGFTVKHTQEGMGVVGMVSEEENKRGAEPVVQAETAGSNVYVDAPLAPSSAAPALMNFNFAYGGQTVPIMNDTAVMATWTHEDDVVKKELRTVTVEVIGEGGTVDPMVGTGYDGEYITFNFFPDDGYAVRYLEVSRGGQVDHYESDSVGGKEEYSYGPIDGDGYIKVGFDSVSHPGANDTLTRYLRTLQALAQTGDLTAPLIAGLLGIAVLALFMAFLTRRRKEDKSRRRHARS